MSNKQRDQLMGHASDNDGIEEYDNPLPDWWLGLFLFCIVWAVGYTVDYHFISKRSQQATYDAEIAAAQQKWPTPATAALVVITPEVVEKGKAVFQQNCASCHGAELQGGIGPNLVDATWIHGGTLKEITATVTNGVAAKGMPTWGPVLGPEKIGNVAAFVYDSGPKIGLEPTGAPTEQAPVDPAPAPAEGTGGL